MIKIVTYEHTHQNGIDEMMNEIALEFNEQIFSKPTSKTPIIPSQYWVALNNGEVIGTVGVIVVENDYGVLKKMMLKKSSEERKLESQKDYLKPQLNGASKTMFPNYI